MKGSLCRMCGPHNRSHGMGTRGTAAVSDYSSRTHRRWACGWRLLAMGSGLRKPAAEELYKDAPPSPPKDVVKLGGSGEPNGETLDEQLDRLEELEAKQEEEMAQRQKAAVSHVVENLFPYAPVKVQTQKYPSSSPHAGKAYLWVTVDEDAIKRRGGGASPVRYPVGVAVDAEGNVFVSESGSSNKGSPQVGVDSPTTRRISAASIVELASTNATPPVPQPPRLVHAEQTSLVVRWKKSTDTTVDRYEVQYRLADSALNPWNALSAAFIVRDVALEGVNCHRPYQFRVRAHNPAGWSDFSQPSDVLWTLPGVPATPRPPLAGAMTNTYISLFWSQVDANGAPPVVFTLEMREFADGVSTKKSYVPIYEGTGCSFVASGLKAKTAYTFRIQASNTIGSSPFVESKAIKTLSHGRPEIVELTSAEDQSAAYDRWVQCWDPKTEQVFFFNKYTCQRVTEEPRELVEARTKLGEQTLEETPEMLFRRKRFRFHRDLRQALHGVNLSATVDFALHRETMYEDTRSGFSKLTKAELFAKPKISFANEAGIDSGGLTKDWYLQISKLAVNQSRRLFKPCDRNQYEIDPVSSNQLPDFRFLGKFMAKAIFDRQTLDLPLCDAVLKHVLHQPVVMEDLHDLDPQFHKSLMWMLDNDVSDVIDETFSVEVEVLSGEKHSTSTVDLKENGRDIPVTNVNKHEYVELILQWRTEFGVKAQLDALLQGISAVIPITALKVFDLPELRMLINGKPTIDVEELRANTVFQGGYNEHAQVVLWLWQALREFSLELRGLFLKFMTGTNKIPLDGFEPPLNITKSDLDPQALPRTHTCFNQIVLPEYTSYETLVDKITFAIKNAEGFELS